VLLAASAVAEEQSDDMLVASLDEVVVVTRPVLTFDALAFETSRCRSGP
jgi:hypothetical protein